MVLIDHRFQATLQKTTTSHVVLLKPDALTTASHVIFAVLAATWLILPILILYTHPSPRDLSLVFSFFTFGFSLTMALVMKARKYELVMAIVTQVARVTQGARRYANRHRYCAVLVVFFSGPP